jgi:crotonobetainyl-CoA:carnitine CoA-transferase CaiB-like acyl-CoA transferase
MADVDAAVDAVYTPAEAFEHPQIEARGYVERPEGGQPRVGFPLRGSEIDRGDAASPPGHGSHTDALLREAGFDDDELERLREDGAIN